MKPLIGQRAQLRSPKHSDVTQQCEFFKDHELAWLDSSSPEAYSKIDVGELLLPSTQREKDSVRLAIEVGGAYIGFCSLMNLSNPKGILELGINIGDRGYWNRGLGKEVIELLLDYGFRDLDARAIELTTNAGNPRAIACFSACGFVESMRFPRAVLFDRDRVDMIEMTIDAHRWRDAP